MINLRLFISAILMVIACALVGSLPAQAIPNVQYAPFGMATSYPEAMADGIPLQWARLFANTAVPTYETWPGAVEAHDMGLSLWLSLWLGPRRLARGYYDTQLAALAASLPPGTRMTFLHEPTTVHNLRIFGGDQHLYHRAFNHGSMVMQLASGGNVTTGPIEVQAHLANYKWINGIKPQFMQFIGIDAYDGIHEKPASESLESRAGLAYAYIHTRFPLVPIGFAEFGTSRTLGKPQWIAQALAWGQTQTISPMIYFQALPPYRLNDYQLKQLGRLI